MLTFGDRKCLGYNGYKLCLEKIVFAIGVGCRVCKSCQLNIGPFCCKGLKVSMPTFGDRKGLSCIGCKLCIREIRCTHSAGWSGCKSCQLNI